MMISKSTRTMPLFLLPHRRGSDSNDGIFSMFGKLRFGGLSPKLRAAANAKWSDAVQALDFFDAKLDDPLLLAKLSKESVSFLRTVRGEPRTGAGLPLSSRAVRAAVGRAMIHTALHYANRLRFLREGDRRLRLLTVCPDIGLVEIASSDYPMMRTKLSIDRTIRRGNVQGVGMLDLALFSPRRGSPEHLAHIHSHHWVWLESSAPARVKDWVRVLAPAKGNRNKLGGRVVTLRSKGNKKHPVLRPENVASLGWYTTKETCGVNTIYQGKGGQKSESNFTDWTFIGAVRQLEFWCYVDARDAVWSVGKRGAEMRTFWRRLVLNILEFDELPLQSRIDSEALQRGWERVWRELNIGFAPIAHETIVANRAPKKLLEAGNQEEGSW